MGWAGLGGAGLDWTDWTGLDWTGQMRRHSSFRYGGRTENEYVSKGHRRKKLGMTFSSLSSPIRVQAGRNETKRNKLTSPLTASI